MVPRGGIAVLTFDDGGRDGLTTVAPLLERLGVRGTFYVCPGGFGNRSERLGEAGAIMTADEAAALHAGGMEIASHTISHRNVLELSDDDLIAEFRDSRAAVEAITGQPCLTLAYPSGRHDARVERAAVDAGYEVAFACRLGPWRRFAAPRAQPHPGDSVERLLERLLLRR
jgi:peptidoglycan/xylan/chitin deacetylase (PgdA/CDA1 family)